MAQKTSNVATLRLAKEESKLLKDPIPNCIVRRCKQNPLNFHFYFFGLQGCYHQGHYHGVLELSPNYPFAAPVLKFYTPSGRFQVDYPICTSFTHYHQETWSSIWTVQTLVIATISFFEHEEVGAGQVITSYEKKQQLAAASYKWNLQNAIFKQAFDIEEIKALRKKALNQKQPEVIKAQVKSEVKAEVGTVVKAQVDVQKQPQQQPILPQIKQDQIKEEIQIIRDYNDDDTRFLEEQQIKSRSHSTKLKQNAPKQPRSGYWKTIVFGIGAVVSGILGYYYFNKKIQK